MQMHCNYLSDFVIYISMIIENLGIFLSKILCFTAYVNKASSFPKPLTPEQENMYLTQYMQGDKHAKEVLIHHNLRLVAHIVKKYSGSMEADDLISVGSLGLIKAINTYNMEHNTQFSTYAARCIENEILMLIRVNKKHTATISVEDSFATDEDGEGMNVLDLFPDETQDVENSVNNEMLGSKLIDIMKKTLTKREYQIICMRFGIDGHTPLTQREVAKELGISRSYISRIETKSLDTLKNHIENEKCL